MQYIVTRIFNNRLNSCVLVSSFEEGIKLIKTNIEDQFLREATEEELVRLHATGEFLFCYDKNGTIHLATFAVGTIT